MRILAGEFKGRKLLSAPSRARTRPITSRAKKSLFDILARRIEGAVVVDLYCGAGTLGLEALSRGARRCFFAERDRSVLQRLRRNVEMLGVADRCRIWTGDVTLRLKRRLTEVDDAVGVAFVDPPFAETARWSWAKAAGRIFRPLADRLAPGGVVVLRLRRGVEVPQPLGGLSAQRTRRYGQMVVMLLGEGE